MSTILRLSLPLTLWLASFSAVYGLHGLLCSSRWTGPDGRWPLIAAALLALALQGALLALIATRRWPEPEPTLHRTSLILAVAAFVGTGWTLMPVAFVSHCL
ncbi:hypothetical protein OG2516_18330 [Oceanicola granulosus HTCC2516]|uniref:Uncharacterized protein n=1 Tax=Oceanicola granulosus (strain ATCC BAA-861 / DSM 15982 / KCTC 12143 / HTCC2516) TaxID=314256 RepID=Q2CHJ0_OCEGH|nr:hypothetical protein [Oceanicola granulosus]EAR52049.1 hypothetical protein OG2516_18330 [Oceanicola granulosus HTCC2516]